MSDELEREVAISRLNSDAAEDTAQFGTSTPYSCLDCGGVLMEYHDGELLRFHCQIGHAYSRESMLAQETKALDRSLWMAYRALEERASLGRRLAKDAERLNDLTGMRRFQQLSDLAEAQKAQIQQALERQGATTD